MARQPVISVVMARDCRRSDLVRCLDSLRCQNFAEPFEVVVASASVTDGRSMAARYPEVRFLCFRKESSKSQLLKGALDAARGEILVVTEPSCYFPLDWLVRIRRAHRSEFGVIGGAVEYGGSDTLVGWACYLADYGPFMPPVPSGETKLLAGNHISYKRAILAQAAESWGEEYAKVFVLWELEQRGVSFFFNSGLVVWCAPATNFAAFARQYYRNASEFAATRARGFSAVNRVAHILSVPALPVLLLFRRVRAVWGKAKDRFRLMQTLPLLAVLVLCWSLGELRGYLRYDRP